MDAITELAKMLKERNNTSVQGVGVGKVVNASPLKINFNGFILEGERIIIAKCLNLDPLKLGESVIVIPTADNGTYFILDKVGD